MAGTEYRINAELMTGTRAANTEEEHADGRSEALVREEKTPRLDRISRRAHELYEKRGGHDGRNVDDWLQAEREIDEADGTRH